MIFFFNLQQDFQMNDTVRNKNLHLIRKMWRYIIHATSSPSLLALCALCSLFLIDVNI